LNDRLHARFGQHPFVGDIRGRGLFRGIELVEDRTAKTPFARERNIAGKIKKQALEQGLICYPMQGTIDGKQGDHVLIAPPFIISDAEIDKLVDLIGTAIDLSIASSA
jgi:adenosylmethionine-8-amino-7-oxononanoate aminotransferase